MKNKPEGPKQACAACRYQRHKCKPDCPTVRYFPANRSQAFQDVHRLFGLSNFIKFLKTASPEQRDGAADSLVFEAGARRRDRVHGAVGIIHNLIEQVDAARKELAVVRHQLSICKQQQEQQQQLLALHQELFVQPPPAVFSNQVNTGVDVGTMRIDEAASLIQSPENEEDMMSFHETSSFSEADLQLYEEILTSTNPAAPSSVQIELQEPQRSNEHGW